MMKAENIKILNILLIAGIWIFAAVITLPTTFDLYGSFGYDETVGKCDYLVDGPSVVMVYYSVTFGSPALLILFSYSLIWIKGLHSSAFRSRYL